MSINQLYVSHQDYQWNSDTTLVTENNIERIINSDKIYNCHTTPEDISYSNTGSLINAANEIYLVDLEIDIIDRYPNSFLLYGRLYNELLKHSGKLKSPVPDFPVFEKFQPLKDQFGDQKVLWTAGCSITAGAGVEPDQRYGHLLSKKLDLPEVVLASNGASISFSADTILRSNIKSGDIVVWGITCPGRIELAGRLGIKSYTIEKYIAKPKKKQYWNLDYFSSATAVFKDIQQIFQVINFCKKIGAELYIVNVLDLCWIPLVFKENNNFLDLTNHNGIVKDTPNFIDLGTDNCHPGIVQHQEYAKKIFELIQERHGQNY